MFKSLDSFRVLFRLIVLAMWVGGAAATLDSAFADTAYRWVPDESGDWGAVFKIGHTFGTHTGRPIQAEGNVIFGGADLTQFKNGAFKIALTALKAGNAALECHLQEALGLDYARSAYPEDHVCVDDHLPASGVDAMTYPNVEFTASRLEALGGDRYAIEGVWKFHGKEKSARLEAIVTREGERLLVRSKYDLSMKDFGVEVKNFLFVSTDDKVTLELNLRMAPVPKL